MLARGRRGRGGGGWARRRRQDANPVEFDKYGFPIPPKKSTKELEEEHKKWMESIEPAEGFDKFDPEAEGFTTEDITSHPLADPAAAESAAAAAAAAATAQAAAAAVAAEEGDGSGLGEYEPDYDDIPEWGGELLGMDDPLDAPWRKKGEELIRAAVGEAGFETYDVTWHLHHLNVDVTPEGGDEQGSLSSDEVVEVTRAIEEALFPHDRELRILQRFHLSVGTPGAKDVLTTEREFQAFRGYEVHVVVRALASALTFVYVGVSLGLCIYLLHACMWVSRRNQTHKSFNRLTHPRTKQTQPKLHHTNQLRSPVNETDPQPLRVGRLMERTPLNTIINVKGRNVTIPTGMVAEVRLPEAKHEDDDFEVMDNDSWGSLFTNGKVPATIECEYEMPGLATLGKGVKLVEPEYYEPPPTDEDEDDEGELGLDDMGLDDEEFADD